MPAEGAEFVEAGDVIEVLVGVKNGIDFRDAFAERLFAKIGPAVDEEGSPGAFEEGGAAGAVIPGMF